MLSLSSASSACSPSSSGAGWRSGIEHDAAQLGDGLVVTQDALVEGVHFRLDWIVLARPRLPAAAVNLSDLAASGASPEASSSRSRRPRTRERRRRARAVRGPERAGSAGRRRRHDAAPSASCSASPRSAVGARARPRRRACRATCSSSPARSAPAAGCLASPGSRPLVARTGRRSGSTRAARSPRTRTPCSTSRTGSRRTPAHLAERSGVRCVIDLEHVPSPRAPSARDRATSSCGFGEDYELLAAVEDAGESDGRWPLRGGRGRRAPARRTAGRDRRLDALRRARQVSQFAQALLVLRLRARAEHLGPRLATLEQDRRRDREDAVARGDAGFSSMFDASRTRSGRRGPRRARSRTRLDRVARLAPGRPEVDDDRPRRLEHLGPNVASVTARTRSGTARPRRRADAQQRHLPDRLEHDRALIFEPPTSRSTNVIGTSTTRKPARSAR